MPIYFLRHAQTDYNAEKRWMGLRDDPLNSVGVRQAEEVAKHLARVEFSHIFVSPLKRALQTAQKVAESQLGKTDIMILDSLRERDFVEFEGRQKSDRLRQELEESASVESKERMHERLVQAMDAIRKHSEPVLVVSHSAVFRFLLEEMEYHSDPQVMKIANAQFVQLLP